MDLSGLTYSSLTKMSRTFRQHFAKYKLKQEICWRTMYFGPTFDCTELGGRRQLYCLPCRMFVV